MKGFLDVIVNMTMHNKTEIREYFTEDWLDKQPFFKDIFNKEQGFPNILDAPPSCFCYQPRRYGLTVSLQEQKKFKGSLAI